MSTPRSIPTDTELALLQVLWQHGPSSVREVHDALGREVAYTSVLKIMQIMWAKKLVRRDESERAHVYEAVEPRERTEARLVADFTHRAFGGSTSRLVLRALSSESATAADLARVRKLLKRHATSSD